MISKKPGELRALVLAVFFVLSISLLGACRDSELAAPSQGVALEKAAPATASTNRSLVPRSLAISAKEELVRQANRLVGNLNRSTKISAAIVDLTSGESLWQRNADLALVPASNAKVLTAAMALTELGLDCRLQTRFLVDGVVKKGHLNGNLVVVGGGDPSLGTRFTNGEAEDAMRLVAKALVQEGLRGISGDIIADDRLFSGPKTGKNWPKDGPWNRWMVEVTPLVFNENRVELQARPQQERSGIQIDPDIGYVSVGNDVALTKVKGLQKIEVRRQLHGNAFNVSGHLWSVGSGYDLDVNVHDGALFYVAALKHCLLELGVKISGGVGRVRRELHSEELKEFMVLDSSMLRSLHVMLKSSHNLFAEVLLRMAALKTGLPASFQGGQDLSRHWLTTRGILDEATVLHDGSGLSRSNRLSAHQLVSILRVMAEFDATQESSPFREALAQPNKSGTLRKRMRALSGKVFAKTGTMNGISALSGYVEHESGRLFAFSVLMNDCHISAAHSVQDGICATLVALKDE